MSQVFQMKMVRERARRIAKGEKVGEQPRAGAVYGEFRGVASMIQGARGGFDDGEVDLGARYLGINSTPLLKSDPRLPSDRLIDTGVTRPTPDAAPVGKASRPVELFRDGTAMDGFVARERIAKADALAEGRSDANADAHETKAKPPAPPPSEATDFTTLMAKINAAIAASFKEVLANAPASPLATTTAVVKSEKPRQPTEAEVQAAIAQNIAFLKRTEREPHQRVAVVKSEDGREVPFILRPHRAA